MAYRCGCCGKEYKKPKRLKCTASEKEITEYINNLKHKDEGYEYDKERGNDG